ncbi:MAG: hypothetical protein ACI4QR_02090, partial [Eubacteriales bacterium]
MNISKDFLEKAKEAKTSEELVEIARAEGIELNEQMASEYFEKLNRSGELSDDELDNVSGGCGYESGSTPLYAVGERVWVHVGKGRATARILSISDEKHDGYCRGEQWIYT